MAYPEDKVVLIMMLVRVKTSCVIVQSTLFSTVYVILTD